MGHFVTQSLFKLLLGVEWGVAGGQPILGRAQLHKSTLRIFFKNVTKKFKNYRKYKSNYRFRKCYTSSVSCIVLIYPCTWKICWRNKAIIWIIQCKKCFVGGHDPDRWDHFHMGQTQVKIPSTLHCMSPWILKMFQ